MSLKKVLFLLLAVLSAIAIVMPLEAQGPPPRRVDHHYYHHHYHHHPYRHCYYSHHRRHCRVY